MNPADIVGKYVLKQKIGAGAFGEVWEARDPDLDRDVAIKFISVEEGEERRRFEREAQTAAALSHPNIVRVHDVGEGYIVMDLVRGVPADEAGLDPRDAARAMRDVASALHHAHGRGIIHRDLKPDNVLVAGGVAHVTDFGLARRFREASTISISGEILGTPAYMSPEQARGDLHALGPATDVYGIGATLYAMLAGGPPFRGENLYDVVHAVLTREPAPPPGDADLRTVVLTCLEKEPMRRYADAQALADDLDRYGRGEPVAARRTGWVPKLARRLTRNKAVAGAAAALLVACVAGTAFAGRQAAAALEQAERRASELAAQEAQQSRAALVQRALLTLMQADEAMAHPDVDAPALQAQLDALARDLEAQLARLPDDAQLHFALGGCRRFLGDSAAADAAYAAAVRCDPGFAEAHLERARLNIEAFAAVARTDFEDADVRDRAETSLREAARLGIGRPHLRNVLECNRLFAEGDRVALERACADAIRRGGRVEEFAYLLGLADLTAPRASIDSAKTRLGQALRVHPNHTGALTALAEARSIQGDIEGAIADSTRVIELAPRYVWAWHVRSIAHRRGGDAAAALADAEQVMVLRPDSARSLNLRAGAREAAGDVDGALSDYERATALSPGQASLYYNRALLRIRLGDLDGALTDLDRAVELHPSHAAAWVNRGALRLQRREFEAAAADLSRALELDPKRYEAHLNRGQAFEALGRKADAEADYRRVLELAPADWPGRDELRRRLGLKDDDF